jgi:hypothetical protein
LTRRLHIAVLAIAVLCAITAALGFLPGTERYHDTSRCDRPIELFVSHHGNEVPKCPPPHYELAETGRAGGVPVLIFCAVVVVLGALVRIAPSRTMAFVWTLSTAFAAAIVMLFGERLDSPSETLVVFQARAIVNYGIAAIVAGVVVGLIAALTAPRPSPAAAPDPARSA